MTTPDLRVIESSRFGTGGILEKHPGIWLKCRSKGTFAHVCVCRLCQPARFIHPVTTERERGHWLTWPGELKPSLCLSAPQTCCHRAFLFFFFTTAAVVRLSFSRCSVSRWARTWRACTAASPPPVSPSPTLTTSASRGTSASRKVTGSGSTSATSAWNPPTGVSMTTSRYARVTL